MKKVFVNGLLMIVVAVSGCSASKKPSPADSLNSIENQKQVKDEDMLKSADGLPMLVDFSAEWCPPCRQMKPVFQKLQTEFEGKVDLVTVDVDDNRDLAERYNVTSIPTLVYISPSGKELYRTVGLQTESIIRADINKYLME